MQYSYIPLFKKTEKLPWGIIFKTIVLILIALYLFHIIKVEQDLLTDLLIKLLLVKDGENAIYLVLILALVPCNWAVEALKWKLLADKIEKLNFFQAFSGILTGLSLGFVTPQSAGDFAGRILQIKSTRRKELVGAIFLGNVVQCIVSLAVGVWGISLFIMNSQFSFKLYFFEGAAAVSTILILSGLVISQKENIKVAVPEFAIGLFRKWFSIIQEYSGEEILKLGFLSSVRYVIFASQFILILILFDVNLPFHILLAGVSWIFAAKTVIPAFNFLSDIGVREFSALLFFSHYNVDVATIIIASLLIWAINILLPTMAGTFLVFRLRVFEK